jgi:DNA-binding NtrC family response regulator
MEASTETEKAVLGSWPVRAVRALVESGPDAGKSVTSTDALSVGTAKDNTLVLSDAAVSRYHLEITRADHGLALRDLGSTNGTAVGDLRVDRAVAPPGTLVRLGGTTLRVDDGAELAAPLHDAFELGGLRGSSVVMRKLMASLRKAATSAAPVLLIGESGTGKELAARALHELSDRAGGPFEVVDCASMVPTLVASELFGHERGAFTGADRTYVGAFERAAGGTVFLDELGELATSVQVNLLGALERKRVRRLGGRADISVDVRIVSATNRDLRAAVNTGGFRLDLYYRVAVITLAMPALREHPEDIPLLLEHFLRESGRTGPLDEYLSPQAVTALRAHHFPGNVRELRNLLEALLAMGELPPLGEREASSPSASVSASHDVVEGVLQLPYARARDTVVADFEGRYLRSLLSRNDHNVAKAAREADMNRSYLSALLRRHDIRRQ